VLSYASICKIACFSLSCCEREKKKKIISKEEHLFASHRRGDKDDNIVPCSKVGMDGFYHASLFT
jgi:hypothetical protein